MNSPMLTTCARECPCGRPCDGDFAFCPECMVTRLERTGVGARMREWTLDTFPRDTAEATRALTVAGSWLDGYRAGERRNLLLFGSVGSGKTGLAWGMLRNLLETDPESSGRVIAWRDLLAELRESFSTGQRSNIAERAQRVSVLVLDDLGAERPTDFARDELATLIERRYSGMRPTIVTSNYDPRELISKLGHDDVTIGRRIVSRLVDDATQLRFTGPDRRLQQGREAA